MERQLNHHLNPIVAIELRRETLWERLSNQFGRPVVALDGRCFPAGTKPWGTDTWRAIPSGNVLRLAFPVTFPNIPLSF